jgi:hypothetical protein
MLRASGLIASRRHETMSSTAGPGGVIRGLRLSSKYLILVMKVASIVAPPGPLCPLSFLEVGLAEECLAVRGEAKK